MGKKWKTIEPGVWKPEKEGDSIEGVLVNKVPKDETAGFSARYYIENKGGIPEDMRSAMGSRLFGCDECQEVCPLNLRARPAQEPDFLTDRAGPWVDLNEVLVLPDQDSFVRRFAGSPLMRAGLRGMKRNACVVAGNLNARECRSALEALATGSDRMLAEHAAWALEHIG